MGKSVRREELKSLYTRLSEQSYLISRGVRPLSIMDCGYVSDLDIDSIESALISCSYPGAYPYILTRKILKETFLEVGFYSEPWVWDTYLWTESGDLPEEKRQVVLGMLLGYNGSAIQGFLDRMPGKGAKSENQVMETYLVRATVGEK